MKLLDRYLQAIGILLPRAHRQDILAELSEDIRSEIEAGEEERGRSLTDDEIEAILKRWGNPAVVAARYQPNGYLIGPTLFPIYTFVLKILAFCYLIPWLVVWVGLVIFDAGYRAAHPGWALIGTLGTWKDIAVAQFVIVTLAFAALDRISWTRQILTDWQPRHLPAVRDPNRVSLWSSISEAVFYALLALWWLNVLRLPAIPELHLALDAGIFYWPALAGMIAVVAIASISAFRPEITRTRAIARLTVEGYCVVAIACLIGVPNLVHVDTSTLDAQSAEALTRTITYTVRIIFGVFGFGFVARSLQDLLRTLGRKPIQNAMFNGLTGA